jgi:hypothetical protein
MRLLLDSIDPALSTTVHALAPQKNPLLRTLALNDVGRAGIPLNTGIRVGIGETPDSWIEAAYTVNEIHARHRNVMAFHVIPFMPQSFSPMEKFPPVPGDTFNHAIKTVRQHLSADITVVAEVYHRLALAPEAVVSGAFDFGPIIVADNERFDIDMVDAISGISDLLGKIHVDIKCVPVIRQEFAGSHKLPPLVNSTLARFYQSEEKDCLSSDSPADGTPLPVT